MYETQQAKAELAAFTFLAGCLDGAVTLLGQDAEYYAGLAAPKELNPIGYFFLSVSPLCFASVLVAWLFLLAVIIYFLSHRTATYFSLLTTGLHCFGATTWLINMPFGVVWTILLVSVFRFLIYPRYNTRNT